MYIPNRWRCCVRRFPSNFIRLSLDSPLFLAAPNVRVYEPKPSTSPRSEKVKYCIDNAQNSPLISRPRFYFNSAFSGPSSFFFRPPFSSFERLIKTIFV